MHRLAQEYATRQKLEPGTYKTVTSSQTLRGWSPGFPIVFLDTKLRFEDIRVINLINTQFTNVQRVQF